MRINLVPDRCCGAAQCVLTAPEVFDQGEDGLVLLVDPTPPEALRERVREAAEYCPSRAIEVVE
ncbi:ferredoxin [Streptomyces sp. NPDC048191]|uniref:ferredoxin n=1 Tax=Streptomyces sp. NPDC048191 TaxID=3155484 RepID=UPI003400395F